MKVVTVVIDSTGSDSDVRYVVLGDSENGALMEEPFARALVSKLALILRLLLAT